MAAKILISYEHRIFYRLLCTQLCLKIMYTILRLFDSWLLLDKPSRLEVIGV